MSTFKSRLRRWVVDHFFTYLALVMGLVVLASVLLAREELEHAWQIFDRRWVFPVLALSLVNYGLRFWKWHRLLVGIGHPIPVAANARIYVACFAMVVTPFRLGELYKLVFLRQLHGVPVASTAPVLVVERLADGVAVLVLAAVYLDQKLPGPFASIGTFGVALLGGYLLGHGWVRRVLTRIVGIVPFLRRRAATLDHVIVTHQGLLHPRVFGPALVLSTVAWGAECLGMHLILVGLQSPLPLADATWIYAVATAVGNVAFTPGGLGGTEASLVGFLDAQGLTRAANIAATILIRAATLWFAVAIGLGVALVYRRALRWSEVQARTADFDREPNQVD